MKSRPSPTWALLVRFGPILVWLIPLALIEVVLRLALSLSYKLLIDHAIIPHDQGALIRIMAFFGCGILAASLVAVVRDALYARASCDMLAALRKRIFDQYQRLSVAYHAEHPPSEILSRLSSDTGAPGNGHRLRHERFRAAGAGRHPRYRFCRIPAGMAPRAAGAGIVAARHRAVLAVVAACQPRHAGETA